LRSANRRILLVGDEYEISQIVRSMLESDGMSVEVAFDRIEPVEKLQENSNFDVVITNLLLLKLDGISVMMEIRRRYPNIAVMYSTAINALMYIEQR
jgi:two-component system, OmpR family, copper resistance phosphate regulon response regulator CusR